MCRHLSPQLSDLREIEDDVFHAIELSVYVPSKDTVPTKQRHLLPGITPHSGTAASSIPGVYLPGVPGIINHNLPVSFFFAGEPPKKSLRKRNVKRSDLCGGIIFPRH